MENEPQSPVQPVVTIPQAEYEQLRQQAQAAQTPVVPVITSPPVDTSQQLSAAKTTSSEKLWFVLAAIVLVSVVFPVGWFLFLPVVLFGVLAAKGFFADASNHSAPVKGGLLAFKVIAIIGMSIFIGIAALFAFFIAAVALGGGHFG